MRTWIKTSIAAAIVGAVGLGAAGVMAKPGDFEGPWAGMMGHAKMERGMMGGRGMGPHAGERGERGARMAERMPQRLGELETALELRAEQAEAWQTFRQSVLDRATSAQARMGEMRGSERPATVLERMQRMEEHHAARGQDMSAMRAQVETFYAQLDDAQKKTFDDNFMIGRGGHARGGRHGPHHGGAN